MEPTKLDRIKEVLILDVPLATLVNQTKAGMTAEQTVIDLLHAKLTEIYRIAFSVEEA